MAHLACIQHGRRVHVAKNSVTHRSDSSKCESPSVKIGTKFYSVNEIKYLIPAVQLKTSELKDEPEILFDQMGAIYGNFMTKEN